MQREHVLQRIEGLKQRGLVDAQAQAKIEQALVAERWADLELFLNQLELEARFASWRPIIRLAMFSSLISALILFLVLVWVATEKPQFIQQMMGQHNGQQQTGD